MVAFERRKPIRSFNGEIDKYSL
ncbi:hypothetical protein CCACVL1_01518 [Corchorus capsularis]|uniref:Uncharacterized protein n=1 Tax=Corchorus capsularis TaxID=210143 RepID=A0A1R3GFK1_COCAP|nr:hypothetical protein CCACVL1_26204 [Corchorus capsularis]OMP06534.1 hypothetical protein CCACVL1_01518 [Corchorus capsularis]